MADKVINLDGCKYDAQTGRRINDANDAPQIQPKVPKTTTTLSRQYVQKPDIKQLADIQAPDPRAKPSKKISQFRREIIPPSTKGPTAKNVSRFQKGDFNTTNRPIILDIKPAADIIISEEQNQKFIEAVKRAEKVDLARRYRASQISRQKRQQNNRLFVTNRTLSKRATEEKLTTTATPPSAEERRAQQNKVINLAIAHAPHSKNIPRVAKTTFSQKIKQHWTKIVIVLLLFGLMGGLVWLNWYNISLNIARFQTNIDVQTPSFQPSGFKVHNYPQVEAGTVKLTYINSHHQTYSISQSKTLLDSQGVLVELVKPIAGDDFSIHRENGLTIYMFDDTTAIWTNGGILYQIKAYPGFSSENIRRIAVSL